MPDKQKQKINTRFLRQTSSCLVSIWLDTEKTVLPVLLEGTASVPSALQKPHWLRKGKNVTSKEHIFNKLSKHGFDVREGLCTRVTKETCTHGDFVVPGKLPRVLNSGLENPFEDTLQRLGISKNITIIQNPLQMSFYLVLLPPHCAGCPQWQIAASHRLAEGVGCSRCAHLDHLLLTHQAPAPLWLWLPKDISEGGLLSKVTESFRMRVLTID